MAVLHVTMMISARQDLDILFVLTAVTNIKVQRGLAYLSLNWRFFAASPAFDKVMAATFANDAAIHNTLFT